MTLDEECKDCLYNSQLKKVYKEQSDVKKIESFKEQVKKLCANPPPAYCAPLLMRDIDKIHFRIFGSGIDYSKEKSAFNRAVMGIEEQLFNRILQKNSPIKEAIKYAAASNYIDFAKLHDLDESCLEIVYRAALKTQPDDKTLNEFMTELEKAKTLLYIHDNCGEIVFDKIFIRVIKYFYPEIEVTSLVRGGEIINDATRVDAEYIGLSEFSRIEDSGVAIPGTYLKETDVRVKEILSKSDVIISKGLGNLETLYGEGYSVYYIFMCKCAHIAQRFGYNQWETAFVKEN